jgi:hypothetical protein
VVRTGRHDADSHAWRAWLCVFLRAVTLYCCGYVTRMTLCGWPCPRRFTTWRTAAAPTTSATASPLEPRPKAKLPRPSSERWRPLGVPPQEWLSAAAAICFPPPSRAPAPFARLRARAALRGFCVRPCAARRWSHAQCARVCQMPQLRTVARRGVPYPFPTRRDGRGWWDNTLVPRCMRQDWGWTASAQTYAGIYSSAMAS